MISPGTVLSAAHCFDSVPGLVAADTVRVGETDLNISNEAGGHTDAGIERVTQHPEWNKNTLVNDLAIVKLAVRVKVPSNKST